MKKLISSVIKFLLCTLAICIIGAILVISESGNTGSMTPLANLGVLLILLSPVIVAGYFWLGVNKVRKKNARAEKQKTLDEERAAEEEKHRDFLRHRFLERQRLLDATEKHRIAVKRNLERSIKKNDYGKIVSDNTEAALEEFFSSISLDHTAIPFEEAASVVYEQLDFIKSNELAVGFDSSNIPFDGHAFEHWVSDALNSFGWEAAVTPASGDQGIDVIAKRDGKTVGLQCKLYSNPIGNKAIQEAHAGKAFHNLDYVAVISNADYTSSAKDLAEMTGVLLLSHHHIPILHDKFFS